MSLKTDLSMKARHATFVIVVRMIPTEQDEPSLFGIQLFTSTKAKIEFKKRHLRFDRGKATI